MQFQPNRLILESGHKLVVEYFYQLPGWRLVLRPSRRRLFADEPDLPSLAVELSKPAFAALVASDDCEARPYLVLETDTISPGIRDLYRQADIPVVEADQAGGRGVFRFERKGFTAKLTFEQPSHAEVVDSIMGWARAATRAQTGSLVRTHIEKLLTEAFESFCEELGICVHHHVPFGYAAGYRQDLPRSTARHSVEMSLSMRPDVDPAASVVLPIRVDSDSRPRDEDSLERDQQIAEFVCSIGMPMAAVQPLSEARYRLTYSLDGFEDLELSLDDPEALRHSLKSLTEHALAATGKSSARQEGVAVG